MSTSTRSGTADIGHEALRDRWLSTQLQALSRDGRPPDLAELRQFLRVHNVSPRELNLLIASPTGKPIPAPITGERIVGSPSPERRLVSSPASPGRHAVDTTTDEDTWDDFDDPFDLDTPRRATASARGAAPGTKRSTGDPVAKLVADLLDDHARTGGVERGAAVALAARRGIDVDQLQQVLAQLEKGGVELEEDVVPAPYDGAGDLDGGTSRRQVGSEMRDQLGDYLARAGRIPLICADVEVRLGAAITAGQRADEVLADPGNRSADDSARIREVSRAGRQAHADLARANLRLVVSVAKHPRYFYCTVELSDRIQDGNIGLLRAAELFDCTLGYKFSTYATWWIRQSIERGIADRGRSIRIPVHLCEKLQKVRRVRRVLEARLGRAVTVVELADELDEDPGKVAAMLEYLRPVASLDAPIGDEDLTIGDLLSAEADVDGRQDPVEVVLAADFHRQVDQALWSALTEREHHIITRRFGLNHHEPQTLDAIAAELGVTPERIRQIQTKVMARLRTHPEAVLLFEYLTGSMPPEPAPPKRARRVPDPAPDDQTIDDTPLSDSSASLPR